MPRSSRDAGNESFGAKDISGERVEKGKGKRVERKEEGRELRIG